MTRPAGAKLLTAMTHRSAVATIGVALGMKSLWNIGNILKCISVIIYSLPPEKRDELVSSDESGKETFKLSPMDTGRIIAGFIQSSLCIIPPSEVSALPPDVRQRHNQKNILHDAAYFHLHDRLGHLDRSGGLLPGLLFNISTPDGVKKALHVLTSSIQGLCSLWLITPDAARRSGNPTDIPAITSCIGSCLQSRQFYVDTHRLLQNLAVRMFGDSVDLSTLGGVNDVLRRIDLALRALLSLNDLVPSNSIFGSDNPQGLVDAIRHSVRSTAISAASTAQQEIFAQLRTFLVAVPDFNIVSFDGNDTTQGKVSTIAHYVASLAANCGRHRAELDIFGEIRTHFLGLPDFDINRFDGSDNSEKLAMISQFIASTLAQHRQRPAQAAQPAGQDIIGEIRQHLVNIPGFDTNRFDRSSDVEKIAMIASSLAQHRQRPAQHAEQDIFGEIRQHFINVPGFDIGRFDGSDNATKVAMLSRLITSMQVDINHWCRQAHCAEGFCREETNRANRAEARATNVELKWKAHVASCRQEQQAQSPSAGLKSAKVSQMIFGGALIGTFATVLLIIAGLWAPTLLAVVAAILGSFWTQLPEVLSCCFPSDAMSLLEDVALYLGQKCLGHSCDEGAPPSCDKPKPSHQGVPDPPPPADVEPPTQHEHYEETQRHADEAELEEEVEVEEPPAPENHFFVDPRPRQSSFTAADPNSCNLYERIGTKASASSVDIKKAYRTASLRFHPDKVPDKNDSAAIEKAKRDMFRINQAKEILLDAELKQKYDAGTLQAGVDYDFE